MLITLNEMKTHLANLIAQRLFAIDEKLITQRCESAARHKRAHAEISNSSL